MPLVVVSAFSPAHGAYAVDALAEAIFINPMEGYIKRLLWALVHLGVISREAANDPWGPELPRGEYDELGRVLDALGETGE